MSEQEQMNMKFIRDHAEKKMVNGKDLEEALEALVKVQAFHYS